MKMLKIFCMKRVPLYRHPLVYLWQEPFMLHPEQPQEQEPPPFFFFLTMLTITMPTTTSKTNKTIKVGKFMLSLSYLF